MIPVLFDPTKITACAFCERAGARVMSRNSPVLNYFGGKASSAHKYPAPKYPLIIEPFAGGAGYSLLHRAHDVVVNDLSADIAAAWSYLVHATPEEVLALPLLAHHTHVDTLGLTGGARALVRMNLQFAPGPRSMITGYGATPDHAGCVWGAKRREHCARVADEIKHWIVTQANYAELPDCEATWFIDPPYQGPAGSNYKHGSGAIDYAALGSWCRSRRGQVIVCENQGATWLPFDHVIENRPGITADGSGKRRRVEVMFYQESQ